jgi:tetratricopeptide (TPR) repeat protein
MLLRRLARMGALLLALGLLGLAPTGCLKFGARADTEVPMGSWPAWQDLGPLLEVAESHVDANTWQALELAQQALREGKPLAADRELAKVAAGSGRHWIAVARADLAALHFTTCIRGVAWRLPEQSGTQARAVDFDPGTKILPGDLSVEALLTNLDDALQAGEASGTLATQARIARVRVTSFTASCPANDEVERRAIAIMNSDLATLAAENHLTPDLAYVWAGLQFQTYSGTAARPFLLQAREGGFDDPSVGYLLAMIAFEQREYDEADALAAEAAERYQEFGDPGQRAQCALLRGEVALAADRLDDAREHFTHALELVPHQVGALIGLTELTRREKGPLAAAERMHAGILSLTGDDELDDRSAVVLVDSIEALVILIANGSELELAQITREALLMTIDAEPDPYRRGLRYFYAATLEVQLGDYQAAQGHAATAQLEFEDSGLPVPEKADPRAFLDRLAEATAS